CVAVHGQRFLVSPPRLANVPEELEERRIRAVEANGLFACQLSFAQAHSTEQFCCPQMVGICPLSRTRGGSSRLGRSLGRWVVVPLGGALLGVAGLHLL